MLVYFDTYNYLCAIIMRFLVSAGGVPLRAPKSQLQLTIVMGFYMERHTNTGRSLESVAFNCSSQTRKGPCKDSVGMQRNRNFLFSEEEKKTVRYTPYILHDVSKLGSFRCFSHVCFHVSSWVTGVDLAEAHDVGRFTFIGTLLLWSRACYIKVLYCTWGS